MKLKQLFEETTSSQHKGRLFVCGDFGLIFDAIITDIPDTISKQQFEQLLQISGATQQLQDELLYGKWNDIVPGNVIHPSKTFAKWYDLQSYSQDSNFMKFIGTWKQFIDWIGRKYWQYNNPDGNDFED